MSTIIKKFKELHRDNLEKELCAILNGRFNFYDNKKHYLCNYIEIDNNYFIFQYGMGIFDFNKLKDDEIKEVNELYSKPPIHKIQDEKGDARIIIDNNYKESVNYRPEVIYENDDGVATIKIRKDCLFHPYCFDDIFNKCIKKACD
jgi:hypothetical protein